MLTHIANNDIFSEHQHGFIKGRSVTSNLLNCIQDWCQSIEQRLPTDIIYIDYSKAFDCIIHSKILHKMKHVYKFHDLIVLWFKNFLSNRKQLIKVNGELSEPQDVISGVAQGSISAAFLYLLFVDELPRIIGNSKISLFADDSKVYKRIEKASDNLELQTSLNNASTWSNNWQLKINENKTFLLRISNTNNNEFSNYFLNNSEITLKNEVRDLGIIISRNLNTHTHCQNLVKKANFSLRNIKNCFPY